MPYYFISTEDDFCVIGLLPLIVLKCFKRWFLEAKVLCLLKFWTIFIGSTTTVVFLFSVTSSIDEFCGIIPYSFWSIEDFLLTFCCSSLRLPIFFCNPLSENLYFFPFLCFLKILLISPILVSRFWMHLNSLPHILFFFALLLFSRILYRFMMKFKARYKLKHIVIRLILAKVWCVRCKSYDLNIVHMMLMSNLW